MKYKVHRFPLKMTKDQDRLEDFLNNLRGEVVTIIPNVGIVPFFAFPKIDFLLIVEKLI